MKIVVDSKELKAAVAKAAKAVAKNSPIPAMAGILVQAEEGKLTLTGTSAELSVKTVIYDGVDVKEAGSFLMDAGILTEALKKLDGEVKISTSGEKVRLQAGTAKLNLNSMTAADFPKVDFVMPEQEGQLKAENLLEAVNGCLYAVAVNDTRPLLTGVNFRTTEGGGMVCEATDSYRMASKKVAAKLPDGVSSACVPASTLNVVKGMIAGDEDITVGIAPNRIVFNIGDTVIRSALLAGEYPNLTRLVPHTFELRVRVNRKDMIEAIERGSFIKQDNVNVVLLDVKRDSEVAEVTTSSQELGEVRSEVAIKEIENNLGEDVFSIAFNGPYATQAPKTIDAEEVDFCFAGKMKPVVILPAGVETEDVTLFLPIRRYE